MRGPFPVLLFAAFLAAPLGCSKQTPPAAKKKQNNEPLRAAVLTVEKVNWPRIVRTQGSLVADEVAVIGTRIDGRVAEVHVDLGSQVKAGTPLVTLDQQLLKLQVSQAEAQLRQARSALGMQPGDKVEDLDPQKSPPVLQEKALWDEARANLKRAAELRKQSAITASEFEQVEFAERVAEARTASALNSVREKIALIGVRQTELALAHQKLADSVIRAPFDGLVQRRQVAPGAFLRVGDPVATLVRTNPLRFRGMLPERRADQLRVGQEIQLQIDSVEAPRTYHISRISPALDPRSRALIFEADIENQDRKLRTGLFAEARVIVDPQAQALVVPHSAVLEFAGAEKVWKVVDGQAAEQEVLIGERRKDQFEILQGLSAGDVILLNAREGRAAKVLPPATPAKTIADAPPDPHGTSE